MGELKVSDENKQATQLCRAENFFKAIMAGFMILDAAVLLRSDDVSWLKFSVGQIRQTLKGSHLSRAIGRTVGTHGKVKFSIENEYKVRVMLFRDEEVYVLGRHVDTHRAKRAICRLVLCESPQKVMDR